MHIHKPESSLIFPSQARASVWPRRAFVSAKLPVEERCTPPAEARTHLLMRKQAKDILLPRDHVTAYHTSVTVVCPVPLHLKVSKLLVLTVNLELVSSFFSILVLWSYKATGIQAVLCVLVLLSDIWFSFLGGGKHIFNFRVSFFSLDLVLFFKHVNIHNFQKLKKNFTGKISSRKPHAIVPQQLVLGPHSQGSALLVVLFCLFIASKAPLCSCWFSACPDSTFWPAYLAAPSVHLGGWSWAEASHSFWQTDSLPTANSFPRGILVCVDWDLWFETSG